MSNTKNVVQKRQNHWWGKGQGLVGNLRGLVGNMLKKALAYHQRLGCNTVNAAQQRGRTDLTEHYSN
jgi:hypothetical protein